jgi:hypothetical protein
MQKSYRNEISASGRQNGALKRNLARPGLLDLDETFAGDFCFAEPVVGVLFCD